MTFAPQNAFVAFLPLEQDFPEDEQLFREILSERERMTASILNVKENAQYEKRELLSGKQYFSRLNPSTTNFGAIITSYIFRLTFDLVELNAGVPIPGGVTTLDLVALEIGLQNPQPHPINIPTAIQPICGYGAANNGTNFYFINDPLVYINTNVWTNASQQIIITNNSGATLTQAVWVFEYIKT